jgi:sulfur-oxidizing protein SoxZ
MTNPMQIRAQAQDGKTMVRVRVIHDMDSGLGRDSVGRFIPAWFIQTINASYKGKTVMSAQWGPAVSKNPFVQFSFSGGAVGEKVVLSWTDSNGEQRSDEAVIT